MTIMEAEKLGLIRLRLPEWNQYSYLELYRCEDGLYGPWATVVDPPGQAALGERFDPLAMKLLTRMPPLSDETRWEPWDGPEWMPPGQALPGKKE